jgi:hypothetical protein
MGVRVTFNYATWSQMFPMFSTLTPDQVTGMALPLAEQYCRNDGGGPVTTAATQTNLLNLMVAHICQLLFGVNGQKPSPLVGRISDATQGSVSVRADFPQTVNSAWYNQTPFGAAFWAATASYRRMTYLPGPRRFMAPWINQ